MYRQSLREQTTKRCVRLEDASGGCVASVKMRNMRTERPVTAAGQVDLLSSSNAKQSEIEVKYAASIHSRTECCVIENYHYLCRWW